MAAQIDPDKCSMCGGSTEPLCVEVCPDSAIRVQDDRVVVTEFIFEDCNECGACAPACGFKINIPEFLKKTQALLNRTD